MNRLWQSKRGTSLVEVLVVMVILAVGIMTVIQMFPSGFGLVKAAESETIASKLAEKELERWKGMAANLPIGILPITDDGVLLNDQDPGPPFTDWTLDSATNKYKRGNVFNIRRIYGETTRIPVASYFQTGAGTAYGSRYTLAFSPIDVTDNGSGGYDGLSIKSGDMRRRVGESDSYPPALQSGQYAIDYGQGGMGNEKFYLAFPIKTSRAIYYVSYSYWVSNSSGDLRLVSVIDQRVPDTGYIEPGNGDWQEVPIDTSAIPSGYSFVELEPDTDTCARGFTEVTSGGFDPDNPYEYYLADSFLGVIAFNPVGFGLLEPTAQGTKPIEARIDYRIYDLRIMREDKVIAAPADDAATTIPIKLALRFILNNGDPVEHPDAAQRTYNGLAPDIGVNNPMLIIDLATGLRVQLPSTTTDPIDFTEGVVNLPRTANLIDYGGDVQASNVDMVGRHLRFFYRADGDWAIQCQKAFALYYRDYLDDTGSASPPDYCHYRLVGDGNGDNRRLKFARTEYGKSVSVDYTYVYDDDVNKVEHKIVGEAHVLSNVTSGGTGCYTDLNGPAGITIKRIYAVVGTSFKVRVLWRDSKRWRYVDMDTNLVRKTD